MGFYGGGGPRRTCRGKHNTSKPDDAACVHIITIDQVLFRAIEQVLLRVRWEGKDTVVFFLAVPVTGKQGLQLTAKLSKRVLVSHPMWVGFHQDELGYTSIGAGTWR